MNLHPYHERHRRAAGTGTDETRPTANYLVVALDSAIHLAALDALTDAAADVTAALPGVTVEVRRHGQEQTTG